MSSVFERKTTGSVVCPSCGSLVGVRDAKCYSCGRANPGLWGYGPLLRKLGADFGFAPAVIGISSLVFALTLLASGSNVQLFGGGLSILAPSSDALLLFGMSGAIPVFRFGWWWTILSASWLHGNLIHIFFNMYWVRQLAPDTVEIFGPARTVIVYVVAGACGFLASSLAGVTLGPLHIPLLQGAGYTIGASASILGLVGAMVHYGGTSGSSFIKSQATRLALMFIVFGFIMPGTDNFAHLGGFAGGYVASAAVKPLTRERGDHMIWAAVCVVATLASIAFSVVHNLPLYLR
jgi:rhomboid protease GluP